MTVRLLDLSELSVLKEIGSTSRDALEYVQISQNGCVLLAEDGQPQGFLTVQLVDGRAHLLELVARPGADFGFIVVALLQAAEQWATAQAVAELTAIPLTPELNAALAKSGFTAFEAGPARPQLEALVGVSAKAALHKRVPLENPPACLPTD